MPAAAQTAPTISVTGEGQVAVTPDMATVSLGVTVNGETAKAALDANSAALSAVIDRLKSAGIEARDIQTTGLSVGPIFDFSSSAPVQKVLGYTASNMVTVQVRAIDQVGPVLDASVTDGANTLNGVMFGLQDQRAATDEARTAAVAEARRRAELLAGAAGVKLGRVIAISDQGGFASPMPMGGMAMDRAASVPVAAGSMTVSASVTVTYEVAE
jgi:uncharacterized protein YggE